MNICTRSIIALNKLFLQNHQVFNHLIAEDKSRVSKRNGDIHGIFSIPSNRHTIGRALNSLTLDEEFSRDALEEVDSLREGDIAKSEGMCSD